MDICHLQEDVKLVPNRFDKGLTVYRVSKGTATKNDILEIVDT